MTAKEKRQYDLKERTARFGEMVVGFAKQIPRNVTTRPLIWQFVKAGTSVGANYCEADDAVSRKDFRNKIGICRKEASETKYWLRMIGTAVPELREQARASWQEINELPLILSKSFHTAGKAREDETTATTK